MSKDMNFVVHVIYIISGQEKISLFHRRSGKLIKLMIFFSRGPLVLFPLNFKPITCACNAGSGGNEHNQPKSFY